MRGAFPLGALDYVMRADVDGVAMSSSSDLCVLSSDMSGRLKVRRKLQNKTVVKS